MFVGRSMEDIVGAIRFENLLYAIAVADIRDDGFGFYIRPFILHHQPDIVLRRFGLVDENHLLRIVDSYLPYHF